MRLAAYFFLITSILVIFFCGTSARSDETDSHTNLINAILTGDLHFLERQTIARSDINKKVYIKFRENVYAYSPLSLTLILGDASFSNRLMELGADIGDSCSASHLIPGIEAINSLEGLEENRTTSVQKVILSQTAICYLEPSRFQIRADGQNSDLLNAILARDATAVKSSIDSGANVNARESNIKSSSNSGSEESKQGRTALAISLIRRSYEITSLLLERGANLNERSSVASRWGSWFDFTPLMLAIRLNANQIALELIERGTDVNLADANGETALHIAASVGNSEMISKLVSLKAKVDVSDENGYTPLISAIISQQVDAVRTLIELGAGLEIRDQFGETPLFHASRLKEIGSQTTAERELQRYQMAAIFDLLLEAGAKAKSINARGETVLMFSAAYGSLDQVLQLLNQDDDSVDPHAKANNGYTAIHAAAFSGNYDVTRLLIEAGSDVNSVDELGHTPLMASTNVNVTRLLIAHGASVNLIGQTGLSALSIAVIENKSLIVSELLNSNADPNNFIEDSRAPPLALAIEAETNREIVHTLLKFGADANYKLENGNTLLGEIVLTEDKTDILNLLLKFGASITMKNKNGLTFCEFVEEKETDISATIYNFIVSKRLCAE